MNFLKKLISRFLPPEAVPTDERRESVRLNFVVDIEVKAGEKTIPARMVNITFTGLCIETETALEEGQNLTLIREESGPSFNGTVLWCKPRDEGKFIVGIECELDEDKLIGSWLEPTLLQAGFEANYVDEKRKMVRVPGRVECELSSLSGAKLGEAKMLDLSRGGALMERNSPLAPNTKVHFATQPLGKLKALKGHALVKSSRQRTDGIWLHGLLFLDVEVSDVEPYMRTMLASKGRR